MKANTSLHADDIFGPKKESVPKYLYIESLDKYLCQDGQLYSDEELDQINAIEQEWKDSQENYTFRQLMEIFPEATKTARKHLKKDMKWHKNRISEIHEAEERYQEKVINKAHFSEQNDLKKENEKYFDGLRAKQESKIKSIVFNLAYLDQLEGKGPAKTFGGVDEADVEQAKMVPISSIFDGKLKVNKKFAVGKCPFHGEKTGSFTIYLNQNSFYCYGCNFGGSVVDYVMKQQNIEFLEAVKFLLK